MGMVVEGMKEVKVSSPHVVASIVSRRHRPKSATSSISVSNAYGGSVSFGRPLSARVSEEGKSADPILVAMMSDGRVESGTESVDRITVGPRTLNNPSGIYVKSASGQHAGHPPNQYNHQPTKRRPLYRPDLRDQNTDSNKTKSPPPRSPLQLRSFAWLNPSKDVFEKNPELVKPPDPFSEYDQEYEYVPVTRSLISPKKKSSCFYS